MLFHSLAYAALLLGSILVCACVAAKHRWLVLLLASFGFYFAWRAEYLALLLLTTTTCHVAALAIGSTQVRAARKATLLLVISLNLAILFLFKYYGLLATSLRYWTGFEVAQDLGFLLPVGISFYTFQAIGYVVDVYRGKLSPEKSLLRTTLFVSFFPQLVAGPIERAGRLLPALRRPIYFRWRNIRIGGWLILWGLFKKVVIADRLSLLVDAAYLNPDRSSGSLLLLATYAFAFQIYCDFSGYTDMAIGSAKIFGIDLMQNFRIPYLATSLRDFWTRWHISLSTWFRDYLYLPLGGSRVSKLHWASNILMVFAISGLWHGAKWTYVIWGVIHAIAFLSEAALSKFFVKWCACSLSSRTVRCVQCLITFHVILLAWVFFRASHLADAFCVLDKLIHLRPLTDLGLPPEFNRFDLAIAISALVWMGAIEIPYGGNMRCVVGLRPRWISRVVVLFTVLWIVNFGVFSHPTQFVYFQF